MDRKLAAAFVSGLALVGGSGFSFSSSAGATTFGVTEEGIRIDSGKIEIDGEVLAEHLSVHQTYFRYLFFYKAGLGLITLSPSAFDGATLGGRLKGRTLEAEVWVALDTVFRLEGVGEVMFGYGDDLQAPERWQGYVDQD